MTLKNYSHLEHWQIVVLDVCQLVPAFLSLVSTAVSLASFHRCVLHRNRKLFRYWMILFLLCSDFLRAIVQFLYPWFNLHAIVTGDNDSKFLAHNSFGFCNFVGFAISYSFDMNDLVIYLMAVHTALLIFRKNSSFNSVQGVQIEGGLYRYRYYIVPCILLIPLIQNTLVFIDTSFYNYLSFCFIPLDPLYIRLVSSWGMRFFVILSIFIIYIAIYCHIYRQYRELKVIQHKHHAQHKKVLAPMRSFFNEDLEGKPVAQIQASKATFTDELVLNNLQDFNERRVQILKNLKYIFVYPLSYFFVWLVPMITQCYRYANHSAPFTLFCFTVFFQALDGFVQSAVFFFREKPFAHRQNQEPEARSTDNTTGSITDIDTDEELSLNDFLRR